MRLPNLVAVTGWSRHTEAHPHQQDQQLARQELRANRGLAEGQAVPGLDQPVIARRNLNWTNGHLVLAHLQVRLLREHGAIGVRQRKDARNGVDWQMLPSPRRVGRFASASPQSIVGFLRILHFWLFITLAVSAAHQFRQGTLKPLEGCCPSNVASRTAAGAPSSGRALPDLSGDVALPRGAVRPRHLHTATWRLHEPLTSSWIQTKQFVVPISTGGSSLVEEGKEGIK
ncbi:hypothetical protein CONLIGDRAFT_161648 [Coniochaeta ligniaria NRRL 30616]|uniref:Uncharacterized protein n=1 Tax=Coniochaeta ligniaria NRRL 30616 TaxID=1408157 RepID=A0A1J7J0W9_9PEZI|nr:hypothetical protein CONLIGDRAFT_161648 [Coniochaeta ligniaria NRRL 30616]